MPGSTIVHVTHWKAGSQWIYKILRCCVPELIVAPEVDLSQFTLRGVQAGKVYPTVYATREVYERVDLPPDTRPFLVIRDLRDTLVSAYYSIKFSHPLIAAVLPPMRALLRERSQEEGLIYLLEDWLGASAEIQRSWVATSLPVLKYEDLIEHDVELLEHTLLRQCALPVAPDRLRAAILANRFDKLTGGRPRGQEDPDSHERLGVAEDWRRHFTEPVKKLFKQYYGDLLIATGYEQHTLW